MLIGNFIETKKHVKIKQLTSRDANP